MRWWFGGAATDILCRCCGHGGFIFSRFQRLGVSECKRGKCIIPLLIELYGVDVKQGHGTAVVGQMATKCSLRGYTIPASLGWRGCMIRKDIPKISGFCRFGKISHRHGIVYTQIWNSDRHGIVYTQIWNSAKSAEFLALTITNCNNLKKSRRVCAILNW